MLQRSCSGELYEVLELDAQCTTAEVTQQYRRLALRYHPDRNAGATVEQFQRIEEAHRVLSDPQQRQLYDTVGREGLKQLGDYGGGMLGSLLLAVGNVAAGCLLIGVMTAALFVSLLISCYKIDAPEEWPSWGVVLIPVWVFLPLLLLASLTVMVACVQRGMYVLLLPSLRLLVCVVIAATTAAALDHRITPVAAFVPWLIWYVLGTLSDLAMLVPTVYSRTHATHHRFGDPNASSNDNAASNVGSAAASEDAFLPGGAGGPHSSSATSHTSEFEDVFVSRPWRTARYWREVAEVIFEAACVYTFIGFAFQRALQQPQGKGRGRAPAPSTALSFWVVMAPLMMYFGLHLLVSALEAYFVDSTTLVAAPSAAPAAGSGNGPHETLQRRRLSCGECVANIVVRSFPSACGLFMTCLWAAKAEYEYNGRTGGADPSAFLAFLPILVVLGALAFLVCCGGCLIVCIGTALFTADDASSTSGGGGAAAAAPGARAGPASPSASGGGGSATSPHHHHHQHSHHRRTNTGGSTSSRGEDGYRSTGTRVPPGAAVPATVALGGGGGEAARAPGAATATTVRRGTAKDVAIEQID